MELQPGKTEEYLEHVKRNSTDGYSLGVVGFSVRWADLMEQRMGEGKRLEEIAKETGQEADTEGITGYMYGCAVQELAYFWRHGEALRRWHNLSTQIGQEGEEANETGGVLNPALLRIER